MTLATASLEQPQSQCDGNFIFGQKTMDVEERKSSNFWLFKLLFNWTSSSSIMLRAVEKKILSFLKTPYRGFFVDIGPAIGEADKIWTISLNTESKEVPLVLLHGLGAGVAMWVMNLDSIAKDRPVYAMDVLGFGRSSRPSFSNDALICEKQFVKSVEEWRREMNINSMVLLGHSMGGFIASSYALSYPEKVHHLILADPWGFPEKPSDANNTRQIPLWVRALAYALTPLNPLWALRAAGPLGQWVVEKTRPDITRKFAAAVEEDNNLLPQYIHQCNAQTPSGESAFHTMMASFGWAKYPMIHRIKNVRDDIPITFIYGSRSWIDSSSGEKIKAQRVRSKVDIKIVSGAGHHVYADKPEVFNRYVNETCELYRLYRKEPIIRETTESDDEVSSTNLQAEAQKSQQSELQKEENSEADKNLSDGQQTDEVAPNLKQQ
ncbi:(Lyso)-N-acylphosphatidylethanolamine lipase isoform X2 [Zeugodacus cucurbitae]|uniref:(Lyso)-N-acylphosphatidylethanolamine lipase isoform X2 n=1 Tax=Zeugodacus cucurbitae TaxID=28588 RepID=UPI0023D937EF|nr:(Lyso)-N-acylphosphatidylethanolamine lipase isoform X2 [Zeugodacus cucurbitae]